MGNQKLTFGISLQEVTVFSTLTVSSTPPLFVRLAVVTEKNHGDINGISHFRGSLCFLCVQPELPDLRSNMDSLHWWHTPHRLGILLRNVVVCRGSSKSQCEWRTLSIHRGQRCFQACWEIGWHIDNGVVSLVHLGFDSCETDIVYWVTTRNNPWSYQFKWIWIRTCGNR